MSLRERESCNNSFEVTPNEKLFMSSAKRCREIRREKSFLPTCIIWSICLYAADHLSWLISVLCPCRLSSLTRFPYVVINSLWCVPVVAGTWPMSFGFIESCISMHNWKSCDFLSFERRWREIDSPLLLSRDRMWWNLSTSQSQIKREERERESTHLFSVTNVRSVFWNTLQNLISDLSWSDNLHWEVVKIPCEFLRICCLPAVRLVLFC